MDALDRRIVQFFSGREGIAAVYLFGSTAAGTAGANSDVDVAVLFSAPQPRTLNGPRFTIEGELEAALRKRVDLVVLNDAPADLAIRVMRYGRLLYDGNRSQRIAFEVRTRNVAFDMEPMLTQYRAARSKVS